MDHGKLLEQYKKGKISLEEALKQLRSSHYDDLGFSKVDHTRNLLKGFPEVIYSANKTPEQVAKIFLSLKKHHEKILATRASRKVFNALKKIEPRVQYNEAARAIFLNAEKSGKKKGLILVIAAGTSDIPVAEEACVTAELMGSKVEKLYDVGVAGLHRLTSNKKKMLEASVIIVVAGMEGALASVVGGLTDKPVVAVPTSVGYGASFEGIAPLLTMLNSCAPGIAVVNIDNGFGAGFFASLVNR